MATLLLEVPWEMLVSPEERLSLILMEVGELMVDGGGAFSGKDYTKVDRSAAYAARWVAKSLVKAGLCKRCLVQVRFFLEIESRFLKDLLFRFPTLLELPNPFLLLKNPIFQETASYGHFGRDIFTWEQPKTLKF